MYCTKCGAKIQDDCIFCTICGNKLRPDLESNNTHVGFKKSNLPECSETKTQELVLLKKANSFKTSEIVYPNYLREEYGIGFPKESLIRLYKKGLIREENSAEALSHLKLDDLKYIASSFGLPISGKKDILCNRLSEMIPMVKLDKCVKEKYWILTEEGQQELNENPYINFYFDNHEYDLKIIGITAEKLYSLVGKKPAKTERVRDILWGEFNRLSGIYYSKAITEHDFYTYCELLRAMALFLEEEQRNEDSIYMYCRYLYYNINFRAGLKAVQFLQTTKMIESAGSSFFVDAELLPFMAKEISRLCAKNGLGSSSLKPFLVNCFGKIEDTGIFDPVEMSDFIMFGLNGDKEGQKMMCINGMKKSSKKVIIDNPKKLKGIKVTFK